jgi:ERF superfamily
MEQLLIKSNTPAMSEDIRALASAFLSAKKEFMATGLAGVNSHQRYQYAKIGDIYNAVEGALSKNNIMICHFARPHDSGIEYLYTRLIHAPTGQFIEDCRIIESEKPGNQGKGAANTYMRKYALLSLCAITTEDDDSNEEERHISRDQLLSEEQLKYLQTEIKTCANSAQLHRNILSFNKIQYLSQLKALSFESVKSYIANNKE